MKYLQNLAIHFMMSTTVLASFPVLAQQSIELRHSESEEIVSCKVPAWDSNFVKVETVQLLKWCVKACGAHGYNRIHGAISFVVGDLKAIPKLSSSEWQLAEQLTPRECLPYQPISTHLGQQNKRCLAYGHRVEVSGMLASYSGVNWMITNPSPKCIEGDTAAILHWQGVRTLYSIGLDIPTDEYPKYKKWIGRQISITGELDTIVGEDTINIVLKKIQLVVPLTEN